MMGTLGWRLVYFFSDSFMRYGMVPDLKVTQTEQEVFNSFPQHEYLSQNFRKIKKEVLEFYQIDLPNDCSSKNSNTTHFEDTLDAISFGDDNKDNYRGWKCHLLQVGMRYGAKYAQKKMPTLMATLDKIHTENPNVLWSGLFSLEPSQNIAPHKDTYSNIVRYHLPILVPTNGKDNETLVMNVADKSFHIEEGMAFCFNGRHVHSVENNLSATRIHLIIDVVTERSIFVKIFNIMMITYLQFLPTIKTIANVDLYGFTIKNNSNVLLTVLRCFSPSIITSTYNWIHDNFSPAKKVG